MILDRLSDRELIETLKRHTRTAREATADAITILAEIEARGLHVEAGYASLFTYCVGELRASKNGAWRWSRAARAVRAWPEIAARIRDGRLSLCAVAVLAERPALLVDGMTKEAAEAALVALQPRAARRDVLSPVKAAGGEAALSPAEISLGAGSTTPPAQTSPDAGAAAAAARPPETAFHHAVPGAVKTARVEPTSRTTSRLHCDLSRETLARLQRAREILPGKTMDAVLGAALELFLARKDPLQRHAARQARRAAAEAKRAGGAQAPGKTTRPQGEEAPGAAAEAKRAGGAQAPGKTTRPQGEEAAGAAAEPAASPKAMTGGAPVAAAAAADMPPAAKASACALPLKAKPSAPPRRLPRRRALPRALADAVVAEAEGQCSFTSSAGQRCTERVFCQKDHIRPLAFGGTDTHDNLRLLCPTHHARATQIAFGQPHPQARRGP